MNYKYLIGTIIGAVVIVSVVSLNQGAHIVPSNDFNSVQKTTTATDSSIQTQNKQLTPNTLNTAQSNTTNNTNNFESPIERFRNQLVKSDLKSELVKEHDKFTRYPSENRSFETEAQDPVTQRYAVDERTTINKDSNMGLTIWSDEKYYLLNDTVNIYAYIQDGEGKKVASSFIANIYYNENQSLGELSLTDQDGDGIFHSVLELTPANTLGKGPGIYKIHIQDIKNKLTDSVTFTLSQPDISLTGNYKEHIDSNGNLIVEAEVSIAADNFFYIQASLYSSTQVAIGVTQFSQQLTKGNHWIPLSFSGLMIQDAKENGPYVLKKVSVAKVTMPMQRAPLVEPDFHTDSYSLSEFSK